MDAEAPPRRTTISFERPPAPPDRNPKKGRFRVRPFLWAAAYVLVTTFSFAPTLSFVDSPAAAGTVASRDVVAPRDLIVPDPDATARRRAEAASEVLPVYDADSLASTRFEEQLRSSFERARATAAKVRPRGRLTSELRDAFTLPIGDEALAALAERGFSRELEDRFVAIGLDLYRGGVVDHRDLSPEARSRGILVRDGSSGKETKRREAGAVEYGTEAKAAVSARLAESPLAERERVELAAFLAATLRPNLTYDAALTAERRTAAGYPSKACSRASRAERSSCAAATRSLRGPRSGSPPFAPPRRIPHRGSRSRGS